MHNNIPRLVTRNEANIRLLNFIIPQQVGRCSIHINSTVLLLILSQPVISSFSSANASLSLLLHLHDTRQLTRRDCIVLAHLIIIKPPSLPGSSSSSSSSSSHIDSTSATCPFSDKPHWVIHSLALQRCLYCGFITSPLKTIQHSTQQQGRRRQ